MTNETLLRSLTIRAIAMREVITVLVARSANATDDPLEALKQISNGLHTKVDQSDPEFMKRIPFDLVEGIRAELDQMVEDAQKLLLAGQ